MNGFVRVFLLSVLGVVFSPGLSLGAEEVSGRDARRDLARAINANDADAVSRALALLVRAGGTENIQAILRILPKVPLSEDSIYWSLVEGVCSFRDREALESLGDTIARNARKGLSRDLLYGLAENKSDRVVFALTPVLKKGPPDLKLLAVRKIGTINLRESVDALLLVLAEEEKYADQPDKDELLWEVLDALEAITGQKLGPNSVNWQGWWEKNRETAQLGRGREDDDSGISSGTVVDSLDRRRKKEFFGLENASKKRVVVLSAKYEKALRPGFRDLNNDHIEMVLDRMRVPHEVVKREDFERYSLREARVLVINCAQFHTFCICPKCVPGGSTKNRLVQCTNCNVHKKFSAKLSAAAIEKIKKFVARGGYLFGEDWIIKEVLEKAWPKYVVTGEVLRTDQNFNTVDVVPARGRATHPYLRGIFNPIPRDSGDEGSGKTIVVGRELVKVKHRWSIDDESWVFDIKDRNGVLVLMNSGELQKRTDGNGVVALAFRPGYAASTIGTGLRGRTGSRRTLKKAGVVLQVLSHFGKQGSTRDEFLLQNLLLNFLIDAGVGVPPAEKS